MHAQHAWWMTLVGGLVGVVLVVGAAVPTEAFVGDGVTGPALSYYLQGDGTIIDNNTGLIWERKTSGSGIHNVNQRYSWSTNDSDSNGTAFTVFLATLNNTCAGNETTACTTNADCTGIGKGQCGYAGHRDWRMPNLKELQSLVDYSKSFPGPTIAASFPGVTAVSAYWSSTTLAARSSAAWEVSFNLGTMGFSRKSDSYHVRAVRGGQESLR